MFIKDYHNSSYNHFENLILNYIEQASAYTARELIAFLNLNRKFTEQIPEENASEIEERIFNYYFFSLSFEQIKIGNEGVLIESLEKVFKKFECDTKFITKLEQHLKAINNDDIDEEDYWYIPEEYDELLYFSLDCNKIFENINEQIKNQSLINPENALVSAVSLQPIEKNLYKNIISNPQLLYAVTWRDFEYLLSKILASLEYEVELQKGTKDGGIDIIAIKKNDIFGEHKYLLQAKKWKSKVGIEPVQRLAFLREHYKATKACLATTSSFTSGALELAKIYPWTLELKDYNGLLDWIKLAKLG